MFKAKTLLREGSMHAILLVRQKKVDPNQTNLFKSDFNKEWLDYVVSLASRMPSKFFMSELRAITQHCPISSKMWGAAGKALLRNGYRMTGYFRQSIIVSRKGGTDKEYERVSN
jgi:hypothetical protein